MIGVVQCGFGAVTMVLADEHEAAPRPMESRTIAVDGPEIDARTWVDLVGELWGAMGSPHLRGLGITSPGRGLVVLDSAREPLCPVWDDDRSAPDAGWCTKKFPPEWWASEIGRIPTAVQPVTKMSWLHRSEPEIWKRAGRFLHVHEFVTSELAGDGVDVTDATGAVGSGWFDERRHRHHPEVLALIDRDRDWRDALPHVEAGPQIVGTWRSMPLVTGATLDVESMSDPTSPSVPLMFARIVTAVGS